MKWPIFAVLLFLLLLSCGPNVDTRTVYQKSGIYPQDFKGPVALFARERNGAPHIWASAFLIDKPRGLFASAKHFVGNESDRDCKIFFNGRIYGGFLITVPEITDLVIIKIEGDFNSESFPEPFSLAGDVRLREKVFVQGIHIHPLQFQTRQKVVPLLGKYYGMIGGGDEFVFDELEGEVVKLASEIKNSSIQGGSEVLAEVSNLYVRVETKEEHRLSATRGFAGLSGGPTLTERGELVGVNAVEDQGYVEIDQRGLTYYPWNSLNLVPVEEVKKLLSKVSQVR